MIYDEKIIKYDSPTILFDDAGNFYLNHNLEKLTFPNYKIMDNNYVYVDMMFHKGVITARRIVDYYDDSGKFIESVSSESISDFSKSYLFNND